MKQIALGEVAEVVAGQSPDGAAYNNDGQGLPFYQGKKEFGDRYLGVPTTWTTEVTKLALAGDILMSVRAPVGPINFSTQRICIGRGLAAIRCKSSLDKVFAFYQLLYKQPAIAGKEGAVFASISRADIEAIKLWVPGGQEQRRIVAILDEAFKAIATAKANTEKNLLNALDWGARQLSTALIGASRTGRDDTLENLVTTSCTLSYGIVQPGDDVPGGLPVVRPVDLSNKTVYAKGLKRIDPALARSYARTTLEGDDLLLCVRGTTGTVAIADANLAGANVTRGIVPIRFDSQAISQFLGYYLLRSEAVQAQIKAKTYGTALMQINIGDLRKIVIKVPPPEQQAELLKLLDLIQESADQLTGVYGRKLAALDELKKSLLHHAFTGQLMAKPTDQQLAEVA